MLRASSKTSVLPTRGYWDIDRKIEAQLIDKFHPDDRDRVSSVYMEGVITKTDSEAEYRYRHADGHYVWLRSSGHMI